MVPEAGELVMCRRGRMSYVIPKLPGSVASYVCRVGDKPFAGMPGLPESHQLQPNP